MNKNNSNNNNQEQILNFDEDDQDYYDEEDKFDIFNVNNNNDKIYQQNQFQQQKQNNQDLQIDQEQETKIDYDQIKNQFKVKRDERGNRLDYNRRRMVICKDCPEPMMMVRTSLNYHFQSNHPDILSRKKDRKKESMLSLLYGAHWIFADDLDKKPEIKLDPGRRQWGDKIRLYNNYKPARPQNNQEQRDIYVQNNNKNIEDDSNFMDDDMEGMTQIANEYMTGQRRDSDKQKRDEQLQSLNQSYALKNSLAQSVVQRRRAESRLNNGFKQVIQHKIERGRGNAEFKYKCIDKTKDYKERRLSGKPEKLY